MHLSIHTASFTGSNEEEYIGNKALSRVYYIAIMSSFTANDERHEFSK